MQIGELAQRTGASRRSIRYYEQQGLLGRSARAGDGGPTTRGAPGAERT
ncbi:MerR family DNA-binding transcriptional regulator [Streptomyces rimosus]